MMNVVIKELITNFDESGSCLISRCLELINSIGRYEPMNIDDTIANTNCKFEINWLINQIALQDDLFKN